MSNQEIIDHAEQPLNQPIDIVEYNNRVAEALQDKKEAMLKAPKFRKERKEKKNITHKPDIYHCKHGFSEKQKLTWKFEALSKEFLEKYPEFERNPEQFLKDLQNSKRDIGLDVLALACLNFTPKVTGIGTPKEVVFKKHAPKTRAKLEPNVTWDQLYQNLESQQYQLHAYHPEHKPDEIMSIAATIEMITDLWACAFRFEQNPLCAFHRAMDWMIDFKPRSIRLKPKFANANLQGFIYVFRNLIYHGISSRNFNLPSKIFSKRLCPLSKALKAIDFTQHCNRYDLYKVIKSLQFKNYMSDLKIHIKLVQSIMHSYSIVTNDFNLKLVQNHTFYHDINRRDVLWAAIFTYRWHIKPLLPVVTSDDNPNPFDDGSSIYDPSTNLRSFFSGASNNIKHAIKNALSHIAPDNIKDICLKLKDQFDDMMTMITGLSDKISIILVPIKRTLGLENVEFSKETAIDVVKNYIIYINTDSTVLRYTCLFMILNQLGIFGAVSQAVVEFFNMQIEGDADSENVATGFDSIFSPLINAFESFISLDPVKVAVPLAFLAFVLFGVTIKGAQLSSLGKSFVDSMKNIHFIGAGALGIGKFTETLIKGIRFVFDWCGKKFFNKVSEDEKKREEEKKFITEYTDWTVQVQELAHDEVGPRNSNHKVIQEVIIKLHKQGIEFNKKFLADEMPINIKQDFVRTWKQIRTLYNIVLRARAHHNFRPTPFHIQLYGAPGIGKSTLIKLMSDKIHHRFYPDQTNYIYAQPQNEQCDGYCGQPIWLIDDAMAANDYKMALPLLTMVSNCPCPLLCSHLENKGTMFTSEWILSTTNTPWPQINSVYCKEALWRRRHLLVDVKIDPKVLDPGTGKFSQQLFEKIYSKVDSHTFPHLKFTFMNPVKESSKLGDLKILPDGVTLPTDEVSFGRAMEIIFARAIVQRKEEEAFEGDMDAKLKLVRENLRQYDEMYELLKNDSGAWKKAYEEFFHTDGYNNKPRKEEPVMTENFAEESTSSREDWWNDATELLDDSDTTKLLYMDGIVRAFKETRIDEGNNTIAIAFNVMGICLKMHKTLEDRSSNRALEVIRDLTEIANGYRGLPILYNGKPTYIITPDDWIVYLSGLNWTQEAIEATIEGLSLVSIMVNIKKVKVKEPVPQATATLPNEDRHLPSGDAELYEALCAARREAEDLVSEINYMMLENNDVTIFVTTYLEGNTDLTGIDHAGLLQALQVHLATDKEYRAAYTANDLDNFAYAFREHLARIVNAENFIQSCEAEIKARFLRQRAGKGTKKKGAKASPHPPEPEPSLWYGGTKTDKGCEIKPDIRFGFVITTILGDAPAWVDCSNGAYPNFYKSSNDFYLTRKVWEQLKCSTPYTSGSTHLSFSFLRTLEREDNNGEIKWWSNPKHVPDGFVGVIRYNVIRAHIDKYAVLSCDGRFRDSLSTWFMFTPAQRDIIYLEWKRHSLIFNLLDSTLKATKAKAASLFTRVWGSLTGSCKHLWQICKKFAGPIALIAAAAAIIGACTSIARLFIPETTSFRASSIFSNRKGGSGFTSDNPISEKCLKGIVRCSLEGCKFQGYKIYNNCLLMPYHVAAKILTGKREYLLTIDIAPKVKHSFYLSAINISRFKDADLVLVYSPSFPAWGDRTSCIKNAAEQALEKGNNAILAVRDENGTLEVGETPYKGKESKRTVSFSNSPTITYAELGVIECSVLTGTSGCPIFLQDQGKNYMSIAGFQSYRSPIGKSYFTIITREYIKELLQPLMERISPDHGPFVATSDAPSAAHLLEPHMELVGYVPPIFQSTQPGKTEFTITPMYDKKTVQRVPAVLTERDPRACGDPARHSLNKHGRDSTSCIPDRFLNMAIEDYTIYISNRIDPIGKLTVTESVEGRGTLKHINLNTSPGIPWIYNRTQRGKKDYIQIDDSGKLCYIDDALLQRVKDVDRQLHDGIMPDMSMQEILKDELRPIGKAYGLKDEELGFFYDDVPFALWPAGRNCKTRTITVMPMEYTILYRQYFGSLITQLHGLAQTGTFPFTVGINTESLSSTNAYLKAVSLNSQGFDLDVSNWDGHFSPQCAEAVASLVNNIYDDKHTRLRRTLINSSISGFVQYKDMVYYKNWGLPSGFPGTADVNTLWHMLMGYAFWLILAERSGHKEMMNLVSYQLHTLDLMYGDDRLVVPSMEVQSWYNCNTVLECYNKFGWPTTSAAKATTNSMRPIQELQFLKRSWNPDPSDPFYIRWALDKSTIEGLLTYIRKTVTPRQQFVDNLQTALDFAADWDSEYYNHLLLRINKCLRRYGYPPLAISYNTMRTTKRHRFLGIPEESDTLPLDRVQAMFDAYPLPKDD